MKWCHEERLPAYGIWEVSQSWSALGAGRVGMHCDCLAGSDAQGPVSVQPGASGLMLLCHHAATAGCPCALDTAQQTSHMIRVVGAVVRAVPDTTWHRHPAPFSHTVGPHRRLRRIVAVLQAHDQELVWATAATQRSHIMLRGLVW